MGLKRWRFKQMIHGRQRFKNLLKTMNIPFKLERLMGRTPADHQATPIHTDDIEQVLKEFVPFHSHMVGLIVPASSKVAS
jgi:hypothetical protein